MKTYLVGGAVRDLVLGIKPKDHDFVIVGATPDDVESLIRQGFKQVGADFPVFLHPDTGEEYALARIERKTGDGYHGFTVETQSVTLEQDLARRDFTMNAMALDHESGEVIDPFGGRRDLEREEIRHTTDAFSEDPLRVLRAARFAARYGFTICDDTFNLCRQMIKDGMLKHLSTERVVIELVKGFGGTSAAGFLGELITMGAQHAHPVLSDLVLNTPSHFAYEMMDALDDMHIPEDKHRLCLAVLMHGRTHDFMDNRQNKFSGSVVKHILDTIQDCDVFPLQAIKLASSAVSFMLVDEARTFIEATKMCSKRFQGGITLEQFNAAVAITTSVKAANFPDMQPGPELGRAIMDEKIRQMRRVLDHPAKQFTLTA